MLRVFRRVTGAASDDVIVKFVAQCEKRARSDPEHRVVDDAPFRRVARFHRKRTALEWHFRSGMGFRIEHVHVKRLRRGVDLVVELVRPGTDDLLEIVVPEFAVVKRVIADIERIRLTRRNPLNHHSTSRLVSGIFLPERNVRSIRKSKLNRPLLVQLRGREDSGLCVIIESVNERVARH